MERTFSITIPENVFQKIVTVATATERTIDDVISNTVNATYTAPDGIPSTLANELASMQQMKDAALWNALEPSFTTKQQKRLSDLNELGSEQMLASSESNEKEELMVQYHRSVLRRAQAIAILTLRGYTITDEHLMNSLQ